MYRNGNPARLKMQFIDLLLVRWIFGRQIGHKNYEGFEHPTSWDKKQKRISQSVRCLIKKIKTESPKILHQIALSHTFLIEIK